MGTLLEWQTQAPMDGGDPRANQDAIKPFSPPTEIPRPSVAMSIHDLERGEHGPPQVRRTEGRTEGEKWLLKKKREEVDY